MTRFAIVVDVDTDEPGATHAAQAIRKMLEPVYGRCGTRTFTGDMFDAYWGLKPVVLQPARNAVTEAEHEARVQKYRSQA